MIRRSAPPQGGYDDPVERVIDEIREDIADGYVTEESARLGYKHYPVTS